MTSIVPVRAEVRLLVAVVVGGAAGVAGGVADSLEIGVLILIATTPVVVVVIGWLALWPMTDEDTRRNVAIEDLSPRIDELVVVVSALSGLGATVSLLVGGGSDARTLAAVIALVGVLASWAALHLMYATKYAHLYYNPPEPEDGIDFNSDALYADKPAFKDFIYFSYNLGMTYQVSDTAVRSPEIRSVVLRHCLLSYLFGAAILATTINLVAGAFTR